MRHKISTSYDHLTGLPYEQRYSSQSSSAKSRDLNSQSSSSPQRKPLDAHVQAMVRSSMEAAIDELHDEQLAVEEQMLDAADMKAAQGHCCMTWQHPIRSTPHTLPMCYACCYELDVYVALF